MKRIILLSIIVFIGLLSFSLNPIELIFETENGSVTCVYFEEHLNLFGQLDPDEDIHPARLNKYIDGDTIHITRLDIIGDTTRLLGIDTPETVHPSKPVEHFGKEASDFVKKVIPIGENILMLTYDWDKYDKYNRLLAYVWVPTEHNGNTEYVMFNLLSIVNGYGRAYLVYPFKDEYMEIFSFAQTYARENNLGLWGNTGEDVPQVQKTDTSSVMNDDDSKIIVYITKTGKKYHRSTCRYLSKSKIAITLENAKKSGYTPCSICNPPR